MAMSPRLLRPRASLGFKPSAIPGLALWLDGADSGTMGPTSSGVGSVSNNGPVKYWRDKSGNGRDLTNSGADSVCPTFVSSYYSGRSALSFDGGDVLSRSASGIQSAPCTIVTVFDETTRVQFAGVLVASPSSGNDQNNASGWKLSVHDGTNAPADITGGSQLNFRSPSQSEASALGKVCIVATIEADTAPNAVMRYNGVAGVADTSYTISGTSAGILVGGRYQSGAISGSFRFNGRIMEIAVWDRALTAAEIASINSYVSRKWGIAFS